MTEKRFEFQNQDHHLNMVYDNKKGRVIFNEDIVECLNTLHEENHQLKKRLQDKDELLQKQLSVNNNLTRTIDNYETSLNNAIDNERTQLGQSVLKQYKNNIME